MNVFYAGKLPTVQQHVLILAEFEESGPVHKGKSMLYRIVKIIHTYHGTFSIRSVEGTHVGWSEFSQHTFDVDSFFNARAHLVGELLRRGHEHLETTYDYFSEAEVVQEIVRHPDERI